MVKPIQQLVHLFTFELSEVSYKATRALLFSSLRFEFIATLEKSFFTNSQISRDVTSKNRLSLDVFVRSNVEE